MPRSRSQTADEVANQRVTSSIQPLLDAIAADRAAAQARAEQARAAEAARIQGFSLAAAEAMRGVGGQINQIYGDAASRQATFGKGVADGFRMAMQGNEAQANALLAQHGGAPLDSVAQQGSNAIHGLGGYLPATELNTQGAAFGAAAAMLPQTALGRGEQDLRDARARWSQQDQEMSDAYDSERRRLLAEVPGLVNQERAAIFERNRAKKADALSERQFEEQKRQARVQARQQWASIRTQSEYLGVSKDKLLMDEAAYMTDMTGELHVIRNGRVVPTGKVATGSDAVAAIARDQANQQKAAGKAKTAKARAVQRRNDKTVSAIGDAEDWVASQVKGGTERQPVTGEGVPVRAYTRKVGKQTVQYYVKKGGGFTTSVDEAATKPVYETVAIPKPQYNALRSRLVSRLQRQLGRFGYKPDAIRSMADEILNDYYTPSEKSPERRGLRTTTKPGRADRRGGP